ncbi:MAG: hypothetical protein ACRCX2_00890 [Paraclostridium sp.]
MNIRFFYNSVLNLKADDNDENRKFIEEKINKINEDGTFNIVFSNHKNFNKLYGPAMIISYMYMCDSEGHNSVLQVDLEARFCNYGEEDEVIKIIKEIISFLSDYSREKEETDRTFGDRTKIRFSIDSSLGIIENSKYTSTVSKIELEHKFIKNTKKESIEFIEHLKEYKNFYNFNKFNICKK